MLIEPTCGKGKFILAAINTFPEIKKIYGIEIYKPYVWETKFSILDYFLKYPTLPKPEIEVIHSDVFEFDFKSIGPDSAGKNVLVLGNPPWVTNATLGGLDSSNLPRKSNFKNLVGLDAMTGKGNFDIAESITLLLLDAFQLADGNLALLVKNTVIKNIVFDQRKANHPISNLEKHCIDSKKEFNVSVEAALFSCRLNSTPAFECKEFNFYENSSPKLTFGWADKKFVSNVASYASTRKIDGLCPLEWRQGMKHDCSAIMEFEEFADQYVNASGEEIDLEKDLVYGLLKSSDLKNTVVDQPRKYTIVTQR